MDTINRLSLALGVPIDDLVRGGEKAASKGDVRLAALLHNRTEKEKQLILGVVRNLLSKIEHDRLK